MDLSHRPLQNLNKAKRDPVEIAKTEKEGRKHLHTSVDAYWTQLNAGRFFLHEHPRWATSWSDAKLQELQNDPRVYTVNGPMCRWEMVSEEAQGFGYVKKETQFLTNSKELADTLQGVCPGGHRHVQLINGRAKFAQVYPPKTVEAVLRAIRKELQEIGELSKGEAFGTGPVPDEKSNELEGGILPPDSSEENEIYFDAVTGVALRGAAVLEAREEELRWVEKQNLYTPVDESECWEVTGRKPIQLKWRENKAKGQAVDDHDLFSAMPPLEALNVLCSLTVSLKTSKRGEN